jgi:hypothetical protein
MTRLRPPLQRTRLTIWMAASLLASASGVAAAVAFGTACDGGRGGAVAVAIAFGALFTSRPVPEDLIEALDAEGRSAFDARDTEDRIGRLRSALAVMLDRQRLEAVFLTVASVSGTLVWGFGDVIAGWLGAAAC